MINCESTPSIVKRQDISSKLAASRRKSVKRGVVILLIVVAASIFYTGLRVDVVNMGYESTELKKQVTDLQELKGKLKSEVEALKSPSRLREIAEQDFQMRPPKGDEIMIVGKGNGAD